VFEFREIRNQLGVVDLTLHATGEGWLYLATVLEAFSRRVGAGPWGSGPPPSWSSTP
jgi:hypothetical protein